jgi:hypothetical protein
MEARPVTDSERDQYRRELIRDVTRAVRQELRVELLLTGLSEIPLHWSPQDRVDLAARLRRIASDLDPRGGAHG